MVPIAEVYRTESAGNSSIFYYYCADIQYSSHFGVSCVLSYSIIEEVHTIYPDLLVSSVVTNK